jgi:hypothetical protein
VRKLHVALKEKIEFYMAKKAKFLGLYMTQDSFGNVLGGRGMCFFKDEILSMGGVDI